VLWWGWPCPYLHGAATAAARDEQMAATWGVAVWLVGRQRSGICDLCWGVAGRDARLVVLGGCGWAEGSVVELFWPIE
jgi:hypothetical protein